MSHLNIRGIRRTVLAVTAATRVLCSGGEVFALWRSKEAARGQMPAIVGVWLCNKILVSARSAAHTAGVILAFVPPASPLV